MHNPSTRPMPGQRWMSENEPELGLGVILDANASRVEILFPAAEEKRLYAIASAPLRRVRFREGESIRTSDGKELRIDEVIEEEGMIAYRCGDEVVSEAELSDSIALSGPIDRLLAGSVDPVETFELRYEALKLAGRIASSPVRGFVGGRIDLIPHQLSIASEVASRMKPRVLLADEVGLGKTIEAGLILHRLHLAGRADRVLVLVPEALIHQWFVELYRRFNLQFSIFDAERVEAAIEEDPTNNPFHDAQHILASIELIAGDPATALSAIEAGWDLLVVDEAHHLEWTPDASSPEYDLVATLAEQVPGLLLLTATPQQLGPEGHFARLRLLDPERYTDLDRFIEENEHYEQVAGLIDRIDEGSPLGDDDRELLTSLDPELAKKADGLADGDPDGIDIDEARDRLIGDILDRFGTGRVMFRNRRRNIGGFPEREALLAPLEGDDEFEAKITWLIDLIREQRDDKLLLICSTRRLAEKVEETLGDRIEVDAALFHEDMPLVRRDKNAEWFAQRDGAQILICSEIGSEGRNFQYARRLILFDLPRNPELLEQRIGRLDRIGQKRTVLIHVPYVAGTGSEVMARWYQEGLDAFEQNIPGAGEVAAEMAEEIDGLIESFDETKLEQLITRTKEVTEQVTGRLERGYDRLLERNSNRPGSSDDVIAAISAADRDRAFETTILRIIDFFGARVIELDRRTWVIKSGQLLTDEFPALPDDGLVVTFERRRALEREDQQFFTIDHPFVRDVLDLFLDSPHGNAAIGVVRTGSTDDLPLLDALAVVEAVAPARLEPTRWLPPRPIRVIVDTDGADRTEATDFAAMTIMDGSRLGQGATLQRRAETIASMFEAARAQAESRAEQIIAAALTALTDTTTAEISRLRRLAALNDHVDPTEITAHEEHLAEQVAAIKKGRVRVVGARWVVGE